MFVNGLDGIVVLLNCYLIDCKILIYINNINLVLNEDFLVY